MLQDQITASEARLENSISTLQAETNAKFDELDKNV